MMYATGKKKTSIAKVFLRKGEGNILINNKLDYFKCSSRSVNILKKPLLLFKLENSFDINVKVQGGGTISQAEAIKHGISKILYKMDLLKEISLKKKFKNLGFLTRDSRVVERKKVGRRKSRKREQYSKR